MVSASPDSRRHRVTIPTDKQIRALHERYAPTAEAASYTAYVGRFGEENVARFAALVERFGEPDLTGLVQCHGHPIV